MAQIIQIHPKNPQPRMIDQMATRLRAGDIAAMPTDSGYALVCHLENCDGVDLIRRIRDLDKQHNFSLLCSDLSQAAHYARIHTPQYRLLKKVLPGAFTLIFNATKIVPKKLVHPRRKTIGIRVPQTNLLHVLTHTLHQPLMAVSLFAAGDTHMVTNVYEVEEYLNNQVPLLINCGEVMLQPSTVIDFTQDPYQIVRQGVAVI